MTYNTRFGIVGGDLLDWLLNNVKGFIDRRDARKYADCLLRSSYIQHSLNKMGKFTERGYYVIGDLSEGM